MGRERRTIDVDPEHVVVLYAKHGRDKDAAAEVLKQIESAPVYKQRLLRERLARAVDLFREARERNDRLGLYRR